MSDIENALDRFQTALATTTEVQSATLAEIERGNKKMEQAHAEFSKSMDELKARLDGLIPSNVPPLFDKRRDSSATNEHLIPLATDGALVKRDYKTLTVVAVEDLIRRSQLLDLDADGGYAMAVRVRRNLEQMHVDTYGASDEDSLAEGGAVISRVSQQISDAKEALGKKIAAYEAAQS